MSRPRILSSQALEQSMLDARRPRGNRDPEPHQARRAHQHQQGGLGFPTGRQVLESLADEAPAWARQGFHGRIDTDKGRLAQAALIFLNSGPHVAEAVVHSS